MVGEGGVNNINGTFVWDGIIPPDCRSNHRILRLNNDSLWEVAREPLHQGIGQTLVSGIGPGMPFANSILKPGETIGLVPCAVAGTPIVDWMRGTRNYNRTLSRARAALSIGGGVIRALLWYQGEADTWPWQQEVH
ncbi:hypothetical protein ACS0TY_026741 [Phlomoides rotata]